MKKSHKKAVKEIIAEAEAKIRELTGNSKHTLMFCDGSYKGKSPSEMLRVILASANMTIPQIYERKRERKYTDMRIVASVILSRKTGLKDEEIAELLRYRYTKMIYVNINKSRDLIRQEDEDFVTRYNNALKAVEKWLRDIQ